MTSGKIPLPGVNIYAANSLTGRKYFTSTAPDGSFSLTIPRNGRYVVRAELSAFAPGTQEVLINAQQRSFNLTFELILASRMQKIEGEQQEQAQRLANLAGQGFQDLGLMQGEGSDQAGANAGFDTGNGAAQENGGAMGLSPSMMSGDMATESVSVSGAMGQTERFGLNSEELQDRIQEMRERAQRNGAGGGPGGIGEVLILGGGGGPGGMVFGGRGRGRGRFNINQPHGTIFYNYGGSALDARPYSLTGEDASKADYNQNRVGAFLGGPLKIPHVVNSEKTFFFLGYFGTLASDPYDVFSVVPTELERSGDFSRTTVNGQPLTIIDPTTGLPFSGNKIPADRISSAAMGLLGFYPLPNQAGVQNFHRVTTSDNTSHNLNLRLMHNFSSTGSGGGRRGMFGGGNNLNVGFNWRSNSGDILNPLPGLGGSLSSDGFNFSAGYGRRIGKLMNRLNFNLNRNTTTNTNLYAGVRDVAAELGVNGVSTDPFDWGPPALQLTHYTGLRDLAPSRREDWTWTIADFASLRMKKHNLRFGFDLRRNTIDLRSNTNPRGTFLFTGFATSAGAGTGYDLADLLLGIPQQTSIQFGSGSYQFAGDSFSFFGQDDWRVRANLTINAGLRYEYVSPYSEARGRLVNLDVTPGFTAAVPVLAGAIGPFTGAFPQTLVEPDRNNFAPRIGIAWKPSGKMVVRAGYGINYNTAAYSSFVDQLAFQPPFSFTETNLYSASTPLSLANGFPAPAGDVTNNFGVDRDYRIGYVQTWNLNVQQELLRGLIMNLDYTGNKGTRLDSERAPNRGPAGLRIPDVQPFLWRSSEAASVYHSGTVRVRKRMARGFAAGGSYTFSRSIDDASTIGGGAVVVAQNDLDLAAERGLSSFDQRHRFTADYVLELPFGSGKRWLNGDGWGDRILGDWMLNGSIYLGSGSPFTARVLGDFTDIARGTTGTLRADYNGQPIQLSDPGIAQYFNTGAFTIPAPGNFGNAGRNTIIGPGSVRFDMSLGKSIPLKDMRAFEFRAQASNLFNHPQFAAIDTVVNSPTFGRVISVGSMRRITLQTRFRF